MIHLMIVLCVVFAPLFLQSQPEVPKLTADLLFSLTGMILSAAAYIIPPFRRFQERLGEWTPLFMAGSLLIVAICYQAVWCEFSLDCVVSNWQSVVLIWGTAFAVNSGFYSAKIKPAKKAERLASSSENPEINNE